jgi:hypothetical protein
MRKLSFLILVIAILFPLDSLAWDNVITHPHIVKQAVRNSDIDAFLQNELGMKPSQDPERPGTLFNGKYVTSLIQEGAELEDNPACRASNHFHDPLIEDWTMSGLTDTHWLVNLYCWGFGFGQYPPNKINSDVTWATGYKSPSEKENNGVREFNEWDWDSAREYYYIYLAGKDFSGNEIAPDEDTRNEYMTKCFRALGQVLHLLQDMAVPAHVRNDFSRGHTDIIPDSNSAPWNWIGNRFEAFVKKNDTKNWFNESTGGTLNDISLTNFWDTNNYDGSIPITDENMLGLAEFANLNFVSPYTIFSKTYPYPNEGSTNIEEYILGELSPEIVTDEDGVTREEIYLSKIQHGININHFVIPSYLSEEMFGIDGGIERTYRLDNRCFKDYADLLIPRAIGYSARLLDYFFRGNIEVLSLKPFTVNDGLGLRLRIKNITPTQEPMIKEDEQPFSLVWHYTPEDANPDGSEDKFITSNYTVCREGNCDEIQYGDEVVLDFYFYWDQAREIYELLESQINCMLVFKGTLGKEQSAVIGKNINPGIGQLESTSLPLFAENASYAVRMKIKNVTPTQEALIKSDGEPFNLVCGYTPEGANPDGSEDIYLTSGENYTCREGDCDNIQYGDEVTIDFNLSMDEEHRIGTQIYESAEDSVKCLLTFNGKIGENDKTVVVGKYFTLGQNQIKFNEEWDNGLTGNYAWDHTQPDDIQNPDLSTLSNKVEATATSNNSLIKSNVRYAGNHQVEFNINETSVGLNDVITPHTYIQFKIDDLSITGTTKPHWQAMVLRFNEGRYLQLSQSGQSTFMNDTTATYYFTLGTNMVVNIFESFQDAGISIPDPFYIQSINFIQEIFPPELSEVRQHMEVDYIRLIEEKQEE